MFDYGEVTTEGGDGGAAGDRGQGGAWPAAGADVAAWCRRITAVSEMEWAELDAVAAMELVQALQRVSQVVRGALASGLAAVDASRTAEHASGLSAGAWWATSMRACGGEGAWLVRGGRLMARFPSLGAAVRAGEVSLDHLRALDAVSDPEVMAALVDLDPELGRRARRLGVADWRRSLRRTVAEVRAGLDGRRRADAADADLGDPAEPGRLGEPGGPGTPAGSDGGAADDAPAPTGEASDAGAGYSEPGLFGSDPTGPSSPGCSGADAHDPDEDPLGWLSCRTTAEGSLLLRGELVGHAAEVFRQALAAETSRRRRSAWREHDATGAPIPQAGELRAAALVDLVRRGVAAGPSTTVARTEAIVVIEADDRAAERLRALDGEPLDAALAALLTCDAHLQALVVGQRGQPLWLGRSHRLATAAQRRTLAVRDGGCIFPGCEIPADWCDVHHQPGWELGGASDLHTMALLCRRHHGLVHSGRWTPRPSPPSDPSPQAPPPPGSGPPGSGPPGSGPPGSSPPGDQRFEWHHRRTDRVLPAAQRGIRGAGLRS